MAQKKIPKEIYNFLSNAEYHLAAALALEVSNGNRTSPVNAESVEIRPSTWYLD